MKIHYLKTIFLVLIMSAVVFGLTSFQPTVLAATGTVSANPVVVVIPQGQTIGTTTITWSTTGCTTAQVWVSMDGVGEALFAQGASGSQQAPWIQLGHMHIFKLYAETTHTTLLATVYVGGVGPGVQLIASPRTVHPAVGQVGTTYLAWNAPGYPNARVGVYRDDSTGPEAVFAIGQTGTGVAPWIAQGHTFEFRLYPDANLTNCLVGVHVSGGVSWSVGVNYNTTTNSLVDGFIQRYNQPAVRSTVQSQLLAMVNKGVTHVKLTLWMTKNNPNLSVSNNEVHFPLTAQEKTNLHQYAVDVAAIVANQSPYTGNRLKLSVVCRCINASAWWKWVVQGGTTYVGDPLPGDNQLTQAAWLSADQTAYQNVVDNVGNVNRPDGQKVCDVVYLDGEMQYLYPPYYATNNHCDWFLTNQYVNFVNYCTAHGVSKPSIYFIVDASYSCYQGSPGYTDSNNPELNGHPSVAYMYRTLKYMYQQGWPLPYTIDFSCFVDPTKTDSATMYAIMRHIGDDLDAVFSKIKARCQFGCAEVHYPLDAYQPGRRVILGAVYKEQYGDAYGQHLVFDSIWPTPGCDGLSDSHVVAPADFTAHIADYLP